MSPGGSLPLLGGVPGFWRPAACAATSRADTGRGPVERRGSGFTASGFFAGGFENNAMV
jgi:hypothetical protein